MSDMANLSKRGWKELAAEEYCKKVADGTHDTPKPMEVGEFLITSRHLTGGKVDLSNAYRISKNDFEKINIRSKVDKWDVLLTMIGTVGEVVLVDHEPEYAIKNIGLFKCSDEIKARWLKYYLQSPDGQAEIQSRSSGTTQEYVALGELRKLPILVPPLSEQCAIVAVLSSLDDKIDLLHRQNKTLESLAEILWRKMFIEDADPNWKTGKLGDEMDITMGQSPAGSTYNEDKRGMVFFQGRAEFDFRFPQTRLYCTEPKRLAKKGDTLVSVRAPVGDINIAYEDCCIGRGLAAVRHKKGYLSYAFYKIRSLKDDFDSFEQQGTVFGSIGKDDFNNIEIVMPLEVKINEFESIAKPLDDKVLINSTQIRTLSHLRDTLLPKLMSGEVRVNA